MAEGMSDAAISDYLAAMRKWPKLPTDFGPETEAIIRRYLRGEAKAGAYGPMDSPGGGSKGLGKPTEPKPATPDYDGQKDSLDSYQLALEFKRHG